MTEQQDHEEARQAAFEQDVYDEFDRYEGERLAGIATPPNLGYGLLELCELELPAEGTE